ncbi:MAG: formylglycine-generating enzyme family protein [bacterium]
MQPPFGWQLKTFGDDMDIPDMNATTFTPAYLAHIATILTEKIISEAARSIRRVLQSSEIKMALERCVYAGTISAVASAHLKTLEEEQHCAEIIERFFNEKDAGRELSSILSGKPINNKELYLLFKDAGYDADSLPGIRFEELMNAFQAGFVAAAMKEPSLQQIIHSNLLEQTRIRGELRAATEKIITFLKSSKTDTVGISAGIIIAQNVVNGAQQTCSFGGPIPLSYGWEEDYITRLIKRCETLDLAAVDDACLGGEGETRAIKVSDVFTTLYLKGMGRLPDEAIEEFILGRPKRDKKEMEQRIQEKQVPIQAIEAFGAVNRLVVLGDPGGGKSTLVNHLAVQLARFRKGDIASHDLAGWNKEENPMPVRIVLREFASWLKEDIRKGSEILVWDYLEFMLKSWGCGECFSALKALLNHEGGVIFFDGLDEVSESDELRKRSRMISAIGDFSSSLKKCRVMVTCRGYAYRNNDQWRFPKTEFPVVELDLFREEQISSFVYAWFKAFGSRKGWIEDKCKREAEMLFSAIQSFPHLQELSPNPLLLTLMAVVHGSTGLPENRADLYERAVRLLLAHWENRLVRDESGICKVEPSVIIHLGLPVEKLRSPLERLALSAHEQQESATGQRERSASIHKLDVLEELSKELGGSLGYAERITDYIQNRAGLLLAQDNRTFTFPHRTFQEYLAATGIMRQKSEPENFLRECMLRNSAYWQEVFLLSAGASRNTSSVIYSLVDTLLPDDPERVKMTREIAAHARIAARAFHETGFITHVERETPPGRFQRIRTRIQSFLLSALNVGDTLTPQDRSDSGTALNRITDPRFNPQKWHLPADENDGFIKIPASTFIMGSDKKRDNEAYKSEFPQHTVDLSEYWIGKYPVTVAQFRVFLDESRYKADQEWRWANRYDNHPVVLVSWHDAMAYCRWLSERIGKMVSLPTEAQWEKAARGKVGRIYPWGDQKIDVNKANYGAGLKGTSTVGCFPLNVSPYGIVDMIGNVWEWCQDWFDEEYYTKSPSVDPVNSYEGSDRVLRGGSWRCVADVCRAALRSGDDPSYRLLDFGFRLCLLPGHSG